MAAAAEYRRQGSPGKDDVAGFDMVRSLGPELAEKLPTLFQPSPDLKRLFDLMLGVQAGKGPRNLILRWIVALSPMAIVFAMLMPIFELNQLVK